ncbi:MAG: NADH-quinone oxidoreductase subunit NuoK [Deltaproteobacteria bacterium]|nr:NADH-quinone oxidoreductase subunit NuoK [Deltaproteobacteria bacterium]
MITELGFTTTAPVGLHSYLVVAAILFSMGLASCLLRKNAIGILIGIELMLNAAVLNFMAFWRFSGGVGGGAGPMAAIVLMVMAAGEAAIALAIFLNLFYNFTSVDVEQASNLEG